MSRLNAIEILQNPSLRPNLNDLPLLKPGASFDRAKANLTPANLDLEIGKTLKEVINKFKLAEIPAANETTSKEEMLVLQNIAKANSDKAQRQLEAVQTLIGKEIVKVNNPMALQVITQFENLTQAAEKAAYESSVAEQGLNSIYDDTLGFVVDQKMQAKEKINQIYSEAEYDVQNANPDKAPRSGLKGSSPKSNDTSDPYQNKNIAFSVLSLMVLRSSISVMAKQSELALQKVQAMQEALAELQAMITWMTAMQEKLSNAFSRDTEEKSQKKGGAPIGDHNNMTWDDVAKHHGDPVKNGIYDFSKYNGIQGFTGDIEKLVRENPILTFLAKLGLLEIKGNGVWGQKKIVIKGKLDTGTLNKEQKAAFEKALSEVDGELKKDKGRDYRVEEYKSETYYEDQTYYDKDGKQVSGKGINDSLLDGAIVFDKGQIPSFLLPDLEKYGLKTTNDKNAPIECYAINQDVLKILVTKIISMTESVTGKREDLKVDDLFTAVTGTFAQVQNQMDKFNSIIKYIQDLITVQAKKPEQAKNDSDFKLQQYMSTVRETQLAGG